nr:MAG TPA: hypothetical protein [Caudoviricetes sp.]
MHVQAPDQTDGAHGLRGASLGLFAGESAGCLHLALAGVYRRGAGVRQSGFRIGGRVAGAGDFALVGHEAFGHQAEFRQGSDERCHAWHACLLSSRRGSAAVG